MTPTKEQTRRVEEVYDLFLKDIASISSDYGETDVSTYLRQFRPRIVSQIAVLLHLIEKNSFQNGNLLSLGGWPATALIILKRLTGIHGTLIDHPALLTDAIKSLCRKEGLNTVAFDFANAAQEPLPVQGPIQLIECCQCIEHWNFSPVPLFKKVFAEVLSTDGFFFVTVPNAVSLYRRLSVLAGRSPYPDMRSFIQVDQRTPGAEVSPHWREYTVHDIKMLMEYCGGACVELHTNTYPQAIPLSLARRLYMKCTGLNPHLKENIDGVFQTSIMSGG